MTRIVTVSDTHNKHQTLTIPDGDIFIHAGDATLRGDLVEIRNFNDWLVSLPHKHKIFVAGNHDWLFERNLVLARSMITGAIYLQDEFITIEGLKIYGSPWQPRFYDWAFNLDRGLLLKNKWELIPEDTDILITHGPPYGILDKTPDGHKVGCEELIKVVNKIKPKLHVFGHIHHAYGKLVHNGTVFVNSCICDEAYKATRTAIVTDI